MKITATEGDTNDILHILWITQ